MYVSVHLESQAYKYNAYIQKHIFFIIFQGRALGTVWELLPGKDGEQNSSDITMPFHYVYKNVYEFIFV